MINDYKPARRVSYYARENELSKAFLIALTFITGAMFGACVALAVMA
jgi:hypothetical protein